jgi:hypothetical protein
VKRKEGRQAGKGRQVVGVGEQFHGEVGFYQTFCLFGPFFTSRRGKGWGAIGMAWHGNQAVNSSHPSDVSRDAPKVTSATTEVIKAVIRLGGLPSRGWAGLQRPSIIVMCCQPQPASLCSGLTATGRTDGWTPWTDGRL